MSPPEIVRSAVVEAGLFVLLTLLVVVMESVLLGLIFGG